MKKSPNKTSKKPNEVIKISFKLDKKEFDKLYEKYFDEMMDAFCDEYGEDDGSEDWIEPKDRTRDYFENMTDSEIVKDFLWTRI